MSCPITLCARSVSTYPATNGAKKRPKFHPKIAMSKCRKKTYVATPDAVPIAMQLIFFLFLLINP